MLNSILSFLWPLQRLIQILKKPSPKITKQQVDKILSVIEPGDILLSYESMHLSNIFIKGEYDHAAIVATPLTVVEAVYPMSCAVPIEEWLYKKDSVIVIRHGFSFATREAAGLAALTLAFIKYDFSFSRKDKRLYCTELVVEAYRKIIPSYLSHKKKDNLEPVTYLKLSRVDKSTRVVIEARNH